MTNDSSTVEVILGAIVAGCRLVSLPLPRRSWAGGAYHDLVDRACEATGVSEIVARDDVGRFMNGVAAAIRPHSALGRPALAAPTGHGFELVQCSSGSTGQPKLVQLDDRLIGANLASIIEVVHPDSGEAVVSWLPLSHDMGLMGMLLASIARASKVRAGRIEIVLLDPASVLRSPALWLRALSERRGAVTAAPDFGYRLCIEHGRVHGLDLSRLRWAIVGGEIVRVQTLSGFARRFRDSSFDSLAFCPAYGMAEVGLAVTITPERSQARVMRVSTRALGSGVLSPSRARGEQITELVSAGPALAGYEVTSSAPAGEIGEILVRGPSIGFDAVTKSSLADERGWLRTGDVGTFADGWLYVAGRQDDRIVAAARNIYAPAIEAAVSSLPSVRADRVVVFGLPSGEWVVAVEPKTPRRLSRADAGQLKREIRKELVRVAGLAPDLIVLVGRGQIPITASGKLQRREAIRRYTIGQLTDFEADAGP